MTTELSPRAAAGSRREPGLLAAIATSLLLLPSLAAAQAIPLGTAATFGVLANASVTNTGPTNVIGHLGVSPGTAVNGFPPGTFSGSLFTGAAGPAGQAQTDLAAAMVTAAGAGACVFPAGADLAGQTLTPGTYCFPAGALLTGTLILDFQGDPNASFLIKTGSTLSTASGSNVLAVNTGGAGCLPNVNWLIGSSATLGTNSNFAGNLLAVASITLTTGANLRGRALARDASVTLDANGTVGGCPVAAAFVGGPVPGAVGAGVQSVPTLQEWSLALLALMLGGVGAWIVRRRGNPAARR